MKEITETHNTTPNATYALAWTANAAALFGATLKPESYQNVSLRFHGDGPLKEVNVQCDARGNIRGLVSPPDVDIVADIKEINFSKSIGAGFITVSKNLGIGDSYITNLPLVYGDVARDFAYYLTTSEQVPSAVILGLTHDDSGEITSSGGILIQTFPDTGDKIIDKIVEGKIEKYYSENCLLEQPFIKDTDRAINDIIQDTIAKLGENIQISRFIRYKLGEDIAEV